MKQSSKPFLLRSNLAEPLKQAFPYFLWGLLFVGFALEHSYHKPWRGFTKTLISPSTSLPLGFDKRIYFHLSDLLAFIFFITSLVQKGPRIFFQKKAWLLGLIIALAWISLRNSCLSHCSLPYFQIIRLLTGFFLFISLANTKLSKETLTKIFFYGVVLIAVFQSLLAVSQYFLQGPVGFFLLNEPKSFSTIIASNGSRWIFDRFFLSFSSPFLLRATGTFDHPNVLGGFLACSLLITTHLLFQGPEKKKQLRFAYALQFTALLLTFSRSGFYGYILGSFFWIGWLLIRAAPCERRERISSLLPIVYLILGCGIGGMILFSEQLYSRGTFFLNKLNKEAGASFLKQVDSFRCYYQNIALLIIQKKPLLGVGYTLFQPGAQIELAEIIDPSQIKGRVHNIYLLLASEIGLLGVMAFLSWIFFVLHQALHSSANSTLGILCASFLALLWIGCVDFYPLVAQPGRILFFTIAALITLHSSSFRERRPE